MMKFIGILMIFNCLTLTGWWIATNGANKWGVISVCAIGCVVGTILATETRFSKFILKKGEAQMEAYLEQATADVQGIAELKNQAEADRTVISLVAKEAAEAKMLSEQIEEKYEIADIKLKEIDEGLSRTSDKLSEVNLIAEFLGTVVAAHSDNRKAFDKLKVLSNDSSFPFADMAHKAHLVILAKHSEPMMVKRSLNWREEVDPSKLSLDDLRAAYAGADPLSKTAFIDYIWERKDIPKRDRVQFLIDVIRNDDSLMAVEYAGKYLWPVMKKQHRPLESEAILQWWEENSMVWPEA